MATQSTFSVDMAIATAGQIQDIKEATIEGKLAAAATNFGTFVSRRASPADLVTQAANPNATTDVTARGLGIAVKDETRRSTSGFGGYEANDPIRIMRKGRCYVAVEGAVTDGQTLFVRFAAGTGTQLGAFRADADAGTAVAFPGLIARQTLSVAGLCLVEINLPQ